jgi:hypothetical protein
MVRNLVLAVLLVVAVVLVSLAVVGLAGAVEVASADGGTDYSKYSIVEGKSIVAENHYILVNEYGNPGNYDIHHDGQVCYRWMTQTMLGVVLHPRIVTYTTPVDDFDLVHIIACES